MSGIFQFGLKPTAMSCVLLCLLTSQVIAATCDLEDSDFPSEECSFDDLGVNKQMLKFGHVDNAFFLDGFRIRFGPAVYSFASSVKVYEVEEVGGCDIGDDPSHVETDDEVAFIPSSTDPRVITDIWILDCTIVQDR